MNHNAKSIRPFIGAKDFEISRNFYRDLGFEEVILGDQMSVFKSGDMAFYLQNAYVKDWIENTMIFMEVDDINRFHSELSALDLQKKYNIKPSPIKHEDWGSECFLLDPAGNLWHFGVFR